MVKLTVDVLTPQLQPTVRRLTLQATEREATLQLQLMERRLTHQLQPTEVRNCLYLYFQFLIPPMEGILFPGRLFLLAENSFDQKMYVLQDC